MAWCFEDEASPVAEAALDHLRNDEAIVPGLWRLEVANVLLVAERRGRITEAQATRFVGLLALLPIQIEANPADISALVGAGRLHTLTAYDAEYLLLAERLAAPLATLDEGLAAAARRAGVPIFGD